LRGTVIAVTEEVVLHLISTKCIPILLYGLESFSLCHYQLKSFDFVINRFFMKLFKTSDIHVVAEYQELFGFDLPIVCSLLVAGRNFLKNLNIIVSHYLVKV